MTAGEEPRTEETRLLWAIFHGPPCEWCGKFVDCNCLEGVPVDDPEDGPDE